MSRAKGLAGRAAGRILPAVGKLLYDLPFGTETSTPVSHEELGYVRGVRGNYWPIGWRTAKRIFESVPATPEDVFLDLGSGKGRAVLLAAGRPYKRVIGVEVSPELHRAAVRNRARSRRRVRCGAIELVNADALDYAIPDDVTVAFLFNPFRGPIFESVARRLAESAKRVPRTLTIVYANPQEEEALRAVGARLVSRAGPEGEESRSHWVDVYRL